MSVIRALLRSRKFVSALTALVASVAVVLGFEEAVAAKLVTAIIAVAGLFILGTAAEDVAEKLARGDEDSK